MKAIAIVLAVYIFLGSCFPQTDFSQFPRIAYAFKHYKEHVITAKVNGITLTTWDFLKMHFLNPQQHDKGHEQEHSQLPFHSVSALSLFTFHAENEFSIVTTLERYISIPVFDQSLNLAGFLSNIFRPPVQF